MTKIGSDLDFVNLASLNLVHDELLVTIEQSATMLEQFASNRDSGELLQECIDAIHQIRGTLRLVQLTGADILADELLELINAITLGEGEGTDLQLGTLTNAYFLLPRYIEYTLQVGHGMPVLLLPHINELRLVRGVAPLPSSYFFSVDPDAKCIDKGQGAAAIDEDFPAFVRRFRHMYQVALLNVLKGQQIKPSLGMMHRAMVRLGNVSAGHGIANLWWVASVALSAMGEKHMELSKPRKMLLGALDRQIKQLQAEGKNGLDRAVEPAFIKEWVYIAALSGCESSEVAELLSVFKATKLSYNDAGLRREMESLQGPSANTLSAMASVLVDELRETKVVLERASQGGAVSESDCESLADTLKRVAEILSVVGLVSAANSLKPEIIKIESWRDGKSSPDAKDMTDVADVLLYVESSVSSIDRLNLSEEKLAEVNTLGRREVMANSQLAEAEKVVFVEAEAGLALIKRALSSFAESDYDRAHINNVASTLNAVRGGMTVLNLHRAAAVVASSVAFIEQRLVQSDQPAAIQQLLETFADAVISLEYYLDAAKGSKHADDSVLEIAEESLDALGFSVVR